MTDLSADDIFVRVDISQSIIIIFFHWAQRLLSTTAHCVQGTLWGRESKIEREWVEYGYSCTAGPNLCFWADNYANGTQATIVSLMLTNQNTFPFIFLFSGIFPPITESLIGHWFDQIENHCNAVHWWNSPDWLKAFWLAVLILQWLIVIGRLIEWECHQSEQLRSVSQMADAWKAPVLNDKNKPIRDQSTFGVANKELRTGLWRFVVGFNSARVIVQVLSFTVNAQVCRCVCLCVRVTVEYLVPMYP